LNIKAVLVKNTYTYSASHVFYSDLSTHPIGSTSNLGTKTFTDGVFKAASPSTVTAATTGFTANAVILYVDTGTTTTSRLIAYLDTMTNLPVATNGGDISFAWDSTNGIFTI
jgi:hypothetical protein